MDKYIEFLLEKGKKIKEENINYYNTLNNKLRELLKQVGDRYEEIKRIIVFGSFIDGSFNTNSDMTVDYFKI